MALSFSLISHFKAKLVQRGENALRSNRLQNFSFDGSTNTIRAVVHASMKDKNYNVELVLNDACNDFVAKKCECPNGLVSCHHMVAASLHAIKHVSSTDKTCSWKQPKVVECVSNVEVLFSKNDVEGKQKYQPLLREPNEEDKKWLLESLQAINKVNGAMWILSDDPSPAEAITSPIKPFEEIISSPDYSTALDQVGFLLDAMRVSTTEIYAVEQATRGQRLNVLWGKLRRGRITASVFGIVLKCLLNGRRPPSLFKKLKGEYSLEGVKSIQWGIDHEEDAVKAYEKITNSKVVSSGLVLHDSGVLGASPDGFVGTEKIVEIKCPFSMIKTTIAEGVCTAKTSFLCVNSEGEFSLNMKHPQGWNYFHQVQGCMHLTKKMSCDFVIWTPKDCQIFNVPKEENWDDNIYELIHFYQNDFLPNCL